MWQTLLMDGVQQNVEHDVVSPGRQAPPHTEHQHENRHAAEGGVLQAGQPVEDVVLPIGRVFANRGGVLASFR